MSANQTGIQNGFRTHNKKTVLLKWLKKIGIWGFLFFLAKGLIWLAVGYWLIR